MISLQPRFTALKFSGEIQQRVFTKYLETFPRASVSRLDRIDRIPEHNPEHIRLATKLGERDPNIRGLNALIVGMIQQRAMARRTEDATAEAEATTMLSDLRVAINTVLGAFRESAK